MAKTVVIFGSAGQGKTSIINLLCELDLPTSNSAVGCTFQSDEYLFWDEFKFIDTVGLNETASGTVSSQDSLVGLVKLLKSCQDGIALIVFVKRQGKLLEHDKTNYEMFVHVMTKGEIPVLCLITGCEEDEDMQEWPRKNKDHFDNVQMHFVRIVGCCVRISINPAFEAILKPKREESKVLVMDAIRRAAARGNQMLPNKREIFRRMWNRFVGYFGLSRALAVASQSLKELFWKVTRNRSIAERLALEVERE